MRKTVLAAALTSALLFLTGASTAAHAAAPAATADGGSAVGQFSRHLFGYSKFVQSGTTIRVTGGYFFLTPNKAYFTVIYGNKKCDPAQAFPVGPFTTNQYGFAILDTTVTAPTAGFVAGTMSVSVRRGDNKNDVDGDGITGPSDVIAVPGKPFIGLQECDRAPVVSPATVTPTPTPSPTTPTTPPTTSTPTATDSPTGTPTETPTDSPTGTPTGTPTDTPSPTGTETMVPSGTGTTE